MATLGPLRYRNRTILAILNLYFAKMPPIKFGFNLHYGSGYVVWRISRWPLWPPSWMLEWNELSSSESPQCLPPSFSLIWLTVREQMSFQDFHDGHHGGHLGYWNRTNLSILNLHITPRPATKFGLNRTYCSVADVVWWFSRWPPWTSEQNDFSNSESLHCSDASN